MPDANARPDDPRPEPDPPTQDDTSRPEEPKAESGGSKWLTGGGVAGAIGFVVLKAGADIGEDQLRAELVESVRREIGPVAAFRDVYVVDALPKTRSGKILRKTMRSIADGRDEPVPSTIEDPAVLDGLRDLLTRQSR